jgi:methionyl-tRNA formyltransferase
MRLVFMGTPRFALPSLEILLDHGYDVAAVVTSADKPRGRGQELGSSPVKELARASGLQVLQPDNLADPQFINSLKSLGADLFVVVAFRILPKQAYVIPPKGSFNLHASLLPKYRGAAPINWALIRGEQETGVTTFFLQEKVDTGSIILQARVKIGPDETAGELHDKLAEIGGEIVLQTVRLIELERVSVRPQDDSLASDAPKIFKEDCRIQWSKSAGEVHNLVRGLSPSPAAWTMHNGKLLKIYRTKTSRGRERSSDPGLVIAMTPGSLEVQTGEGVVTIVELQQEGRRRMGVEEFLRGYRMKIGDRLA